MISCSFPHYNKPSLCVIGPINLGMYFIWGGQWDERSDQRVRRTSTSPSSPPCVFFRCWPVMGNLYGARGQFKLLQQCGLEKRAGWVNIVNNSCSLHEFQQGEEAKQWCFSSVIFSDWGDGEKRGALGSCLSMLKTGCFP